MSALETPVICCAPLGAPTLDETEALATAELFKALGDPARVRIVNLLATSTEPVCACELYEPLALAQPTVSHHLKKLTDAGLLERPGERLDFRAERRVADGEQPRVDDHELVDVVVARGEVRAEEVVAAVRLRVVRHLGVRGERVAEQGADRADREDDREPPERERAPRTSARRPCEPSREVVHPAGGDA